ncbi:MAG: type I-E CRISPR-associated protein Cse1/CasA, partial [Lactobacillus iners]|nr:type I-E CRISPR-associated protein Cse1/CasA [Lactobacillus iners]
PKRKPGIIEWLNDIDESIKNQHIKINAISMEDDGNATSWVPINEVEDKLDIGEFIVNDLQKNGWVDRINNIVDRTKDIIEKNYRAFLNDIAKIRGIESGAFTSSSIESMYFKIDKPFRDWLTNINYDDNKDEKEQIWNKELKNLVIRQAKIIIEQASPKDFTGIIENDSVKNIVTAYNNLMSNINKKL